MKRLLLELLSIGICATLAAGAFWRLKHPHSEEKPVLISRPLATRLSEPLQEGASGHVVIQALDYQCPPCHAQEKLNRAFRASHPDVSWRLLQFPLRMHKRADELAKLMLAAPNSESKRKIHERLMEVQVEGSTNLAGVLGKEHLESLRRHQAKGQARIDARLDFQKRLPITGTPSYLVFRSDGESRIAHSVIDAEQFLKGVTASSGHAAAPGCEDTSAGCQAP